MPSIPRCIRDVVAKIRRYLGTKVITSGLVGVLVWASLAIIGLELAGVFGILAFLLNFIPVIGPIIVTVLPIPLAVVQFQSPWPVVLVVVIPGVHSQRHRKHHRAEADGRGTGSAPGDHPAGLVVLGPSLGHCGDVPGGPDHGRHPHRPDAVRHVPADRESAGRRFLSKPQAGQRQRPEATAVFNSSRRNRV